jgi:hypothetical protein
MPAAMKLRKDFSAEELRALARPVAQSGGRSLGEGWLTAPTSRGRWRGILGCPAEALGREPCIEIGLQVANRAGRQANELRTVAPEALFRKR